MNIIIDKNKTLIKTAEINLYQGESLVDKIKFLIPKFYKDLSLEDFEVSVKYTIPGNVGRKETLTKSEVVYEDSYFCYLFPVDSKITAFAGNVSLSLVLTKEDQISKKIYVMRTSSVSLPIIPTEAEFKLVEPSDCGDTEFEVVEF